MPLEKNLTHLNMFQEDKFFGFYFSETQKLLKEFCFLLRMKM